MAHRADEDPMYAAYVLVLVMGLRTGEVLGLTWPGVDLGEGELVIEHQLQRVRRELLHRETKTAASDARRAHTWSSRADEGLRSIPAP